MATVRLENHLIVLDREGRDTVLAGKFVHVTPDRTGAEQRVQHSVRNTGQRQLRDLKVPRIVVGRRANGELAIQIAAAESNFLQRNSDLNASDIVVDGNKSL